MTQNDVSPIMLKSSLATSYPDFKSGWYEYPPSPGSDASGYDPHFIKSKLKTDE